MPNVIITPAFAHIRAQAEADKYNALASGVQNASNIVAQTLFAYSQRQREDENAKFQILDKTVERYGEQADQTLLSEYDKLLRKKGGFGLPKDDQGRLKPIPPQDELSLLRQNLGTGTPEAEEATANWIAKKTTGMSKVEQHLEAAKQAETERYHDLMSQARMLSANASMYRVKLMELRGMKDAEGSRLIRNSDGTLVNDQGQEIEPGQVRLSVAQAKADYNKRQIEQLGEMRSVNNQIKQQDLKVKELTFGNLFLYGSARGLLPLIDMEAKQVLPKEMKPILDKGIDKILKDNGITEPADRRMWITKIISGWTQMPDDVKKEALEGAAVDLQDQGTSNAPIKRGHEIVPGVKYLGER